MTTINQARLVIYKSENGRDGWVPVDPAAVPDWVKRPNTMGRLVAGEQCMNAAVGAKGSEWYMAKRIVAAGERRTKRVKH